MILRWPGRATPATAERDASAVALARRLLAETRGELARADAKASTLLAGAMVAVGIIASALADGRWSPLDMRPLPAMLWGLAILAGLGGLACLLACIYPRRRRRDRRHVLGYFDHVREVGSDDLVAALRARSAGPELDHLAAELAAVSAIAARKYTLIRWGIRMLAAASGLAVAGVLTSWIARG